MQSGGLVHCLMGDIPEYLQVYKGTGICIRSKTHLSWCPASDWSQRNAYRKEPFSLSCLARFWDNSCLGMLRQFIVMPLVDIFFLNLSHHFLNPLIIWTTQHSLMKISAAELCMANVISFVYLFTRLFFFLSCSVVYYKEPWTNLSYSVSQCQSYFIYL